MNWRNIKNIKQEEYGKKLLVQITYPDRTIHLIGMVKKYGHLENPILSHQEIYNLDLSDEEWFIFGEVDADDKSLDVFYIPIDEIKM